jgi:hypothetical protein
MTSSRQICAVEACGRPVFVVWAALCQPHYGRLWATGSVGSSYVASRPSARRWRTGAVTYDGAMQRLLRTRGRAADNPCARCGEPAAQWRLIDPASENVESSTSGPRAGLSYSGTPTDYEALCTACLRQARHEDIGQPGLF